MVVCNSLHCVRVAGNGSISSYPEQTKGDSSTVCSEQKGTCAVRMLYMCSAFISYAFAVACVYVHCMFMYMCSAFICAVHVHCIFIYICMCSTLKVTGSIVL